MESRLTEGTEPVKVEGGAAGLGVDRKERQDGLDPDFESSAFSSY